MQLEDKVCSAMVHHRHRPSHPLGWVQGPELE